MPPKGWTSGRPEGTVKAVRLSEDIIERVARHMKRLQAQLPDVRVNEGVALRHLIRIGLDSAETGQLPLMPQPTSQPAIPLALEPAPQAALRPMEPQADAPQEAQPSPLVTHETLTPSEEADQEPAPAADLPLPEPPTGVQTVHLPEPREPVHQPPSHLETVEEPEPMAPPMATPQAPAAPSPEAAPDEERIVETPSTRSQRGLPREKLQEIADMAAQYNKLSLAQLSQLLYDRNIYRAKDRKRGEEKPVHRGTLQHWLDQARAEGML